jgi:hypothetical protein
MPQARVSAAARDEVVKAFYPSLLSAGQAARDRAQSAFSIASAITAVLVAGGAFADIGRRSDWLKGLGLLTLAAWVATAFLFLRAVASPVASPNQADVSSEDFARAVLANSRAERDAVQSRQRTALWTSGGAMILTLMLLLFTSTPDNFRGHRARLSLTQAGDLAASAVCPTVAEPVVGDVDANRLGGAFIQIRNVSCAGHATRLWLMVSSVRAIGSAP